jgi:cell division protein FtsW
MGIPSIPAIPAIRALRPARGAARRHPDRILLGATLLLLVIGLAFVYSSSAVLAADRGNSPAFFLGKQLLLGLTGLFALFYLSRVDYGALRTLAVPLLLGAVILLLLVYVPGLGLRIKGSRRWLDLGVLVIQPTEFARLALLHYLAHNLARRQKALASVARGLLPPLLVLGGVAALIVKQPNLGSAIALLLIGFVVLFAAGARARHLALLAGLGLLVCVLSYAESKAWPEHALLRPHQIERIDGMRNLIRGTPDAQGSGYQLSQSLVALGSGGLLGKGLGSGFAKWFFLPDPHTDFIFAIVGEELGLLGTLTLLALLFVILWRGVRIAGEAPDFFGYVLAVGITASFGLYAFLNVAVATGLGPTTGLPLPFVSYGGSALLSNLCAVGILLSISRHARSGRESRA